MANESIYVDIKCPYFKCVNVNKGQRPCISCESIDIKSSYSTLHFSSTPERDGYIKNYCNNFPNKCRLAKSIDKKYES